MCANLFFHPIRRIFIFSSILYYCLALSPQLFSQVNLVSNTSSGNTWTGANALQDAIQVGPKPQAGDTLVVYPGNYSGLVNIHNDGHGFNIISYDLFTTGIITTNTMFSGSPSIRISASASNISLQGLTFIAATGIAAIHGDADNLRILSNRFIGCSTAAISFSGVFGMTNATIARNLFVGVSAQAIIDNSFADQTYIYNNTIDGNASTGDGVNIASGTVYVSNNIFVNIGNDSADWAIDNSSTLAEGNNVYSNVFGTVSSGISASSYSNTDPLLNNYHELQNGSPAIDQGVIIPGISSSYIGSAPDIGWLETITPCTAPPNDSPTFSVANISDRSVELSWTDSSNEVAYLIYYSTGGKPASANLQLAANTSNYQLSGLNPITTYNIWVTASNGCGITTDLTTNITTIDAPYVASNINTAVAYYTLQPAIDAANSGDTLVLFDFTNTEHIYVSKTNLTIVSLSFLNNNNSQSVILRNSLNSNAIFLKNSVNVDIAGITITGDGDMGVRLEGGSGNRIHNSYINNQKYFGLSIILSSENRIYSNRIEYNRNGIWVSNGAANTHVYRNLIFKNDHTGISAMANSANTEIINNTIVSNGKNSPNNRDGIEFYENSSGSAYNNIIAYNGGGFPIDFGLDEWSTGTVLNNYNTFYANTAGGSYQGTVPGANNNTSSPLINLSGDFEILSESSPAFDSGNTFAGITDGYYDSAPDRGWKEKVPVTIPIITQTNIITNIAITGMANYIGIASNIFTNADPVSVFIEVDNNGSTFSGNGLVWSSNINTASYSDGPHVLTFIASNITGSVQTLIQTNIFDNSGPNLSITNLSSNVTVSNTIAIRGLANDPHSGVSSTFLIISNNSSIITQDISGSTAWLYSLNTTTLSDGLVSISITGTNGVGIGYTSAAITFSVNNNIFYFALTSSPSGWNSGIVSFSGYASNSNTSFDPNIISNQTNNGALSLITSGTLWSNTIDTSTLHDGVNTIRFFGQSGDGQSKLITHNLQVDNSPPNAGISSGFVVGEIIYIERLIQHTNNDPHSPIYSYLIISNASGAYYSNYIAQANSFTINPKLFANGSYVLSLYAVNATGLSSTAAVYNIDINNLEFNPQVGPNPLYRSDGTQNLYITGLKKNSLINIYTISGVPLRTFDDESNVDGNGILIWDLKNNDENVISSGVYIISITDTETDENVIKKISIE